MSGPGCHDRLRLLCAAGQFLPAGSGTAWSRAGSGDRGRHGDDHQSELQLSDSADAPERRPLCLRCRLLRQGPRVHHGLVSDSDLLGTGSSQRHSAGSHWPQPVPRRAAAGIPVQYCRFRGLSGRNRRGAGLPHRHRRRQPAGRQERRLDTDCHHLRSGRQRAAGRRRSAGFRTGLFQSDSSFPGRGRRFPRHLRRGGYGSLGFCRL